MWPRKEREFDMTRNDTDMHQKILLPKCSRLTYSSSSQHAQESRCPHLNLFFFRYSSYLSVDPVHLISKIIFLVFRVFLILYAYCGFQTWVFPHILIQCELICRLKRMIVCWILGSSCSKVASSVNTRLLALLRQLKRGHAASYRFSSSEVVSDVHTHLLLRHEQMARGHVAAYCLL